MRPPHPPRVRPRSAPRPGPEAGLTLIELVVASALLAILASAAMPLFQASVKRGREVELRFALRSIRRGLDLFNESYVASGGDPFCGLGGFSTAAPGRPAAPITPPVAPPAGGAVPGAPGAAGQPHPVPLIDISQFYCADSRGYPPNLKLLVNGVQAQGGGTDDKDLIKFLRRIPRDPMLRDDQVDANDDNFGWGVRSYQDEFDCEKPCDFAVWGRQNVFDVYSKSRGTALDGSKYCEW